MTRRFYAPEGWPLGETRLDEGESHHLQRVLRAEAGFAVEVFDGRGATGRGVLAGNAGKRAVVRVETTTTEPAGPELVLATAVPKGDRFAWLVEKGTELGVARIVPLVTRRSVVDPGSGKLDKLRQGVIEACKQCGRSRLMTLDEPMSLANFVRGYSETPVSDRAGLLVAHPGGAPLSNFSPDDAGRGIVVVIGPEGGLDEAEVAQLVEAGGCAVSLSRHILRVETAALVVAAWHGLRGGSATEGVGSLASL
jgi:16S rRNA (uracil1498-N3)-methyltransferase